MTSDDVPKMPTSSSHHTLYFARNWIGFFLLGLINTLPYATVTTAAKSIADGLDRPQFLPTIYGAAGSATIIAKIVNAVLVNKVHYGYRFLFNSCLLVIGSIGIAIAQNFKRAIFAVVTVGAGNAFGENVALGYLSGQGFDDDLVNAWSSGTGFAGLLGASLFVLAGCIHNEGSKRVDLRDLNEWVFLIITPMVLIYLLSFMKIIIPPTEALTARSQSPNVNSSPSAPSSPIPNSHSTNPGETQPLLASSDSSEVENLGVLIRTRNWGLWRRRITTALWVVLPLAVNLGLSTFLSFVTRVAASKAVKNSEYNKGCPEIFASLQLCYQAGVFVSKSSLQIIKIKFLYHLTVILFFSTLMWLVNERFKFLPVYVLPASMILVGLLNGAVYVNTFYLVQTEMKYGPPNDRELCTNITAIFINIGVSCCAILQTILDQTVFLPF